MSLVLPSLWITPVKTSISGLMCVTGVTFLMDNTSEDQYIRTDVSLCLDVGPWTGHLRAPDPCHCYMFELCFPWSFAC